MTPRALPVLELRGSPYERGHVHGSAARPLVELGVARWRETLANVADGDVDAYLSRFVADTDFLTAIRRWTPDLVEEIDGIADGAGIDLTTMLAYQFMDEQWCYEHRKVVSAAHHCSSVGIARRGGGRIVAQNMDLPVHFDGTQVLLRSRGGDRPEALLFTAAGLIVTTGMNSAGVGVCVNSIMDRPTAASGLPVAFAIRGALARSSAADAVAFLRDVDHASGQNYVVGDSDGVTDLEAAADGVAEYAPGEVIVHTNHSLAVDTSDDDLERYAQQHRMDLSGLRNSHDRRRAVVDRLGEARDATTDDVVDALSDLTAPVCRLRRADSAWMTFGSVIYSLTESPSARIAPGPPTDVPYATYGF